MIDDGAMDAPVNRDERWVRAIYELAGMQRPSASEGERIAAESIADHLRALGCETEVEQGRAHGGYRRRRAVGRPRPGPSLDAPDAAAPADV